MIRLIALTAAGIAMMILGIVVREERLAARGRVPMGRLRRLLPGPDRRKFPRWRVDYPIRYQRLPDGAGRRPAAQAGSRSSPSRSPKRMSGLISAPGC